MATDIKGDIPSALVKIVAEINKIKADLTEIRSKLTAHTHGGVTVGAGVTAASTAVGALTAAGLSISE